MHQKGESGVRVSQYHHYFGATSRRDTGPGVVPGTTGKDQGKVGMKSNTGKSVEVKNKTTC